MVCVCVCVCVCGCVCGGVCVCVCRLDSFLLKNVIVVIFLKSNS